MLANGQEGGASAVGEEAEETDANEALGQHVEEEAPEEFVGAEGHDPLLAAMGVVLPPETDLAVLEGDQPMVGNGDAMGVTGQVVQNIVRTAKGRLGVNDPVLAEEGTNQRPEKLGIAKGLLISVKSEFPLSEGPLQARHKLAAKHAAENLHR